MFGAFNEHSGSVHQWEKTVLTKIIKIYYRYRYIIYKNDVFIYIFINMLYLQAKEDPQVDYLKPLLILFIDLLKILQIFKIVRLLNAKLCS